MQIDSINKKLASMENLTKEEINCLESLTIKQDELEKKLEILNNFQKIQ
jgi:hypothetical protein